MSFHPDGTGYGMTGRGSQLFTFDAATGLADRVGTPCPPDADGNATFCARGNAIAFDAVANLFWANGVEIARLDPSTGLVIESIPLDFSPFGLPTDPDAGFRVVGMDFHPVTGKLYAAVLQRQPQDSPPPRSTLAILDPWTGTFEIIGEVDGTEVNKLEGIAFTPGPDHYRCYAVKDESNQDEFLVSLEDQFGFDPAVEIEEVVSICAPVDKDGEGIIDPHTHFVCYEIDDGEALRIDAAVSNQFGMDQELAVRRQKTICVPSLKRIINNDDDDDDDDDDDGDENGDD